jgi:hypothetical protein
MTAGARRLRTFVTAAAVTAAVTAAASPAVTVRDLGSVAIVEAALPGPVIGYVPACGTPADCHGLLLLVRARPAADGEAEGDSVAAEATTEARPPLLLRLDPSRAIAGDPAGALSQATPWVPYDAGELALIDLDGDGDAEVAAGESGRLWSLGPPGALEPPLPVLAGAGVDLAASRRLVHPLLARFPVAEVGRLRWFAPADGKLAPAGSAALPVEARRRRGGLELSSPEPALMPGAEGAPPSWVAGPEAHGDRRLRSVLIDPTAPDGAAAEAWALLPGAERVASSQYVRIDGRPALVVFTHGADKLRLFDQKRLRVFLLAGDRTRAGSTPALAAETRSHMWQRAEAAVADFDGDGRDDVAVAQVKGMFDGEAIEIDTYRGLGGGRFEPKPRRVRLKVADAGWRWTEDLDGDRLPDLVATSEGRLLIFTGAGRRRGAALAEEPAWQLTFPAEPEAAAAPARDRGRDEEPEELEEGDVEIEVRAGAGGAEVSARHEGLPALGSLPRALDLDGDGRAELVSVDTLPDGRERLRVIVLRSGR